MKTIVRLHGNRAVVFKIARVNCIYKATTVKIPRIKFMCGRKNVFVSCKRSLRYQPIGELLCLVKFDVLYIFYIQKKAVFTFARDPDIHV